MDGSGDPPGWGAGQRDAARAEPRRPARQDLPETLAWRGEFGAKLVLFLPFMAWLDAAGMLAGRRISTCRGMRCFSEGLGCAEIIERDEQRPPLQRRMPAVDEHDLVGNPYHLHPDLRARFRAVPLTRDPASDAAPLLVVHDKYTRDRFGEPVNFLEEATLGALLTRLKETFRGAYIRHGKEPLPPGYSQDRTDILPLGDDAVLRALRRCWIPTRFARRMSPPAARWT